MPDRLTRAPAWPYTAGLAVVFAAAFLLMPRMGTDLSAQQARADFFAARGWAPIDFGWYGGIDQFGYSLFTAALGAATGVRVLGAVAALVASLAFQWLLLRCGAPRPLLGGVLGAFMFTANLVSGRITFAVGLALGLLALCARLMPGPRAGRVALVALAGALATWASPVAGLFLGVAGAAVLLAACWDGTRAAGAGRRIGPWRLPGGLRAPRGGARWPEAVALCVAPAVALAPMALLFGDGGEQPFTAESLRIHLVLALLVTVLVSPRFPVVRVGGLLAAMLLLVAFYLPSPIGSNALRLPLLFTLPVLGAFVELSRRWLVATLAVVCWWQLPVVTSDLDRAGSAESKPAFYRPLTAELARRPPGRIEVVPLRDHWESTYVAAVAPLARGWERQVDTDRNALFYADTLDPADYADWLRANAVSYVAVAPNGIPDRYARAEAALVLTGPPVLREVWRDDTWRLYEVVGPQPLVAAPGALVAADRGGVALDAVAAGAVPVRVRWNRWLSVDGGCLTPAADGWTTVRVPGPGRYRLTSALRPGPRC